MTREQIEQAADAYTKDILEANTFEVDYEESNYDAGARDSIIELCPETFIAGANWRINSVWHDASEEPNRRDMVIVLNSKGEIYDFGFWGVGDKIREGHTWARMKDLIPIPKEKKGGAE